MSPSGGTASATPGRWAGWVVMNPCSRERASADEFASWASGLDQQNGSVPSSSSLKSSAGGGAKRFAGGVGCGLVGPPGALRFIDLVGSAPRCIVAGRVPALESVRASTSLTELQVRTGSRALACRQLQQVYSRAVGQASYQDQNAERHTKFCRMYTVQLYRFTNNTANHGSRDLGRGFASLARTQRSH